MSSKTRPPKPSAPAAQPWQVILEEIRSQNRGTIEAVDGRARELKNDITQLREQANARLEVLEAAVRQSSTDVRHLQGDVKQLQTDVRALAAKVDRITVLEERVGAIERRRA